MSEQAVPESVPKNVVEGLLSQLDASKQMFNEALNSQFQLRTQCVQLDKMVKDLSNQVKQLKENLAAKDAEIAKLSNPQASDVKPDPAL